MGRSPLGDKDQGRKGSRETAAESLSNSRGLLSMVLSDRPPLLEAVDLLVAQAPPIQRARLEVLDHDVHLGRQTAEDLRSVSV